MTYAERSSGAEIIHVTRDHGNLAPLDVLFRVAEESRRSEVHLRVGLVRLQEVSRKVRVELQVVRASLERDKSAPSQSRVFTARFE